jgi:hypothetical protein
MVFELCCGDETLARRLAQLYAACEVGCGPISLRLRIDRDDHSHSYRLYADGTLRAGTAQADEILKWCAWEVNRAAIEHAHARTLVLHAAAARRGSRAVILAGPSGAGKSTVVSALTLAGFCYMGDDGIAVDARNHIVSNPKPIAIDDAARRSLASIAPTSEALRRSQGLVAPADLGAVVSVGTPVEPAVVIRLAYRPGAGVSVSPSRPGDVAELLADQSFNFARLGRESLAAVAAIARSTTGAMIAFDDLDGTVDAIAAMVA